MTILKLIIIMVTNNNNNKHLFIILFIYLLIYNIFYPYTIIRAVRPSTCNVRNVFVHLSYGSKVFLSTIPYTYLKVNVTDFEVYNAIISRPLAEVIFKRA